MAALCSGAVASDQDHAQRAQNVTFENDVFFGSDRYYTNGIQFERRYRWNTETAKQLDTSNFQTACRFFGCGGYLLRSRSHRAGQLMYTPTDITISAPQPNDRPWAGLFYYAQDNTFIAPSEDSLTRFTLQVGAMGPASLAEHTQKLVHKIVNSDAPKGWSNQAKSELGVLVGVERKYALDALSGEATDGWQWRGAGSWRVAGGNIMTLAGARLEMTFGKNLPRLEEMAGDIVQTIQPGASTSSVSPAQADLAPSPSTRGQTGSAGATDRTCLFSWLECQATVAVEARLTAHNAFLDGPLFRNGPKVNSRPLVADASIAFLLRFPRTATQSSGPLFVQFKATRRSPEFKSSTPVKSHTFGALTVGCDFF